MNTTTALSTRLKFLIRLFAAGVLLSATSFGIFLVILDMLTPLTEGMNALLFGYPVLVFSALLGLLIAAFIGFFILPKTIGHRRFYILGFGVVFLVQFSVGGELAFPTSPIVVIITGASLLTGLIFIALGCLVQQKFRKVTKIALPILVIICMGWWVIPSQHSAGVERVQVNGIKRAGYDIYIPDPTVEEMPKASSITPIRGRYDGYDKGVRITMAPYMDTDIRYLYEFKFRGKLPTASCGNGFDNPPIRAHLESEAYGYKCSLVSQKGDISVYLREWVRVLSARGGDYGDVAYQTYFAIAGSTEVWLDVDSGSVGVGRREVYNPDRAIYILENLRAIPKEDYSDFTVMR